MCRAWSSTVYFLNTLLTLHLCQQTRIIFMNTSCNRNATMNEGGACAKYGDLYMYEYQWTLSRRSPQNWMTICLLHYNSNSKRIIVSISLLLVLLLTSRCVYFNLIRRFWIQTTSFSCSWSWIRLPFPRKWFWCCLINLLFSKKSFF